MEELLARIKNCDICKDHLPHSPRPVVQASVHSRILIIGQAPGRRVQQSGIPWDDPSGDQLRSWLGIGKTEFYDPRIFALVPMGFCYPGKGASGDLAPRPECAPLWHEKLISSMPDIKLAILIGKYAQDYYLGTSKNVSLTERVKHFGTYLPAYFPLVHPSPRNKAWQKRNPWFVQEVIPFLQQSVKEIMKPV